MSRIQLGQPKTLEALLAILRPILERLDRQDGELEQQLATLPQATTTTTIERTVQTIKESTLTQQVLGSIQVGLSFDEAPDGSRVLFTPSAPLALDGDGGARALVWRQQVLPFQTRTNPPPMGRWYWTGTQVRFNEADAPSTGEPLFLAVAVLAS